MFDLQQCPISAPAPDEHRNYPLHVYTLGRFSVSRGLKPIRFVRKAQHRPLELLKVLVALGGRGGGAARLPDESSATDPRCAGGTVFQDAGALSRAFSRPRNTRAVVYLLARATA